MAKLRRTPTPKVPGKGGAITLRLSEDAYRRLGLVARADNRNPTNYVETLVLRDLAAKDEAAQVIAMLVPEGAAAVAPGVLERSEGESDARYADRSALMDRLFALPDSD